MFENCFEFKKVLADMYPFQKVSSVTSNPSKIMEKYSEF